MIIKNVVDSKFGRVEENNILGERTDHESLLPFKLK
jgi:hypothetical protein